MKFYIAECQSRKAFCRLIFFRRLWLSFAFNQNIFSNIYAFVMAISKTLGTFRLQTFRLKKTLFCHSPPIAAILSVAIAFTMSHPTTCLLEFFPKNSSTHCQPHKTLLSATTNKYSGALVCCGDVSKQLQLSFPLM